MRSRHPLLLAAAWAALSLASPSTGAAGPWLPRPGEYYSEFRAGHSSSSQFIDNEGVTQDNPFEILLEGRRLVSRNEFGWKRWMSVAIEIPLVSSTVRSGFPFFNGTETGLGDLALSAQFPLMEGATALSFEAGWVTPMGYDREAIPGLGSGVQNLGGRIHFGSACERLNAFAQLSWGYVHRLELPADRLAQSADLGIWLGSSVLLVGSYQGSIYAGGADGQYEEFDVHSAGPEVRMRLDDRMDVFAGSRHVFAGRAVDQQNEYFVGLTVKRTRLDRLQGLLGGKRRATP